MRRGVIHALFSAGAPEDLEQEFRASPIASDVVDEALDALITGLLAEISGFPVRPAEPTPIPDGLFRPGGGAALCVLTYRDAALKLLLPADALSQAAPPKPAVRGSLTPLRQALESVPVKLGVELSRAELTLGYLNTLAIGDVLALPTKVDQALRVLAPGEVRVCDAHLGTAEGRRAIELIKLLH